MDKQVIYEKVAKVMAEIEPIAKERRNTQQGYNFRGIDELMNALSPIVTKHGIFPTCPIIADVLHEPVTSKTGGAGTHLIRRYTFRFYAEDGSFVETLADGEAIDYGDKASNKAYSVAYREAMFKMFVIPFQNEDIEEGDHDIKPPAKPVSTGQTEGNKAKPAAKPIPPKSVEQARLAKKKRIAELCDEKSNQPLFDGAEYARFVQENTGLTLEEGNYNAIIERLEALQ
jgi:hypothetical protein